MHFPAFLREKKEDLPSLKLYQARDKESLSYRIYESSQQEIIFIFLHGSGSHGEYLHICNMCSS